MHREDMAFFSQALYRPWPEVKHQKESAKNYEKEPIWVLLQLKKLKNVEL